MYMNRQESILQRNLIQNVINREEKKQKKAP